MKALCRIWPLYIHDSIWSQTHILRNGYPPFTDEDTEPHRACLSNILTRSSRGHRSSQGHGSTCCLQSPGPGFTGSTPHTLNDFKIIRTPDQILYCLCNSEKEKETVENNFWGEERTTYLWKERSFNREIFVFLNAACFSAGLLSDTRFLFLPSLWVQPNPSRQTRYIISLSICYEDCWLQPSILAPWRLLPPCLPPRAIFLYPAINHL